jgi:hypothetical protein
LIANGLPCDVSHALDRRLSGRVVAERRDEHPPRLVAIETREREPLHVSVRRRLAVG